MDTNSTSSISSRIATSTTVNAALVSGEVPSAGGKYSGGGEGFDNTGATDCTVERRVMAKPSGIGARNSMRLPAHMRRGSGTGGRKPPRFGCPSGPISDCRARGRK